ncbi:MAG: DUF167 domain-containing protein [Alphaproteobacteria bacterium]|nr:DUF167 domain-containing protein [Alphaproteobacteria bacterium]
MSEPSQITVKLTPKASKNAIVGWEEDAGGQNILKVCVTAVPEKGKANKALIALLSQHFKKPKSAFSILRGESERIKLIGIDS